MQFNSSITPSIDDLRFPEVADLLNFINSSTVPAEIQIPAEFLKERINQLNGDK